jgi:hypothetical protein
MTMSASTAKDLPVFSFATARAWSKINCAKAETLIAAGMMTAVPATQDDSSATPDTGT